MWWYKTFFQRYKAVFQLPINFVKYKAHKIIKYSKFCFLVRITVKMDNDIDMDHFDHDQVYIEEPEEEFVEEPMGDGDFDMAAEYAGFDQLGMPEGESAFYLFILMIYTEESLFLNLVEEPTNVTVVETTTVDLESLVNEYSDYALMSRLLFIAKCCPPLKIDALRMLIDYVKKVFQRLLFIHFYWSKGLALTKCSNDGKCTTMSGGT
jgi:hypothetical protein